MNTVELLHEYLDNHPTDQAALMALADAVEESGGPGLGWQAISKLGREPEWFGYSSTTRAYVWCWFTNRESDTDDRRAMARCCSVLPGGWFQNAGRELNHEYRDKWRDYLTRRAALEAAALAFVKLPPNRQSELLALGA